MMFIIFTYGVKTPKEILGTSHLVVIIVTMVIHRLKIHLEEYLGIRHMVVMSVLIMMMWIFFTYGVTMAKEIQGYILLGWR